MNDCPATSMVTAKTSVSSALANWDISFGKSGPSNKNPIANSRGSTKFHAASPETNARDCGLPRLHRGFEFKTLRELLRQVPVEECRQLAEVLLGFGRIGIARILRMRLPFEHVEIGNDAGLTQLAMHPHRIGQEQITRARCQNGRRKTGEVAVDRRKLRILQVMTIGIELCGIAEPAI